MKNLLLLSAIICFYSVMGQSKIPSTESQIKTALLACPEMYQENAKILGYNQKGELITLREGKNEMICLADNPDKEGISVSCYSNKLEDYMTKGRELIAEGKTEMEKQDIRKQEIDAGILTMPKEPAAVYVVTALQENYNFESGELKKSRIRYVFYKPYMTAEETGLPTQPGLPGMPWLMDADTHRSHIMITPPAEN
ncbi:MAG: hypothetical protein ABI295_10805 [Xanthomarina sp.]